MRLSIFTIIKQQAMNRKLTTAITLVLLAAALYSFRETNIMLPTAQRSEQAATLSHILIHTENAAKALSFYQEALAMRIHEKAESEGETRYFLSNNDSHHQLVLMEKPALAASNRRVMQQIAFNVPDHASLVQHYLRLKDRYPLELKNNQISWSVYLHDPDGNQVEIYWDIRDQAFGEALWNGNTEELAEEALLRGHP